MLTATFKNPKFETEINTNGFVHIPGVFSIDEINSLYKLYKNNHISHENQNNIFWNSTTHLSEEKGSEISSEIITIANPHLEKLFNDWIMPVATFMSKRPISDSLCPAHRDNSIFDENQYQYRNIWIPLIDVDINNGTLFIIPRSHLLFSESLPMFSEWPYSHLIPRLEKEYHSVTAKAGDLIVYLDRTLHGSYKNTTRDYRPVVHGGLIHNNAQIQYQRHIEESDEIEIYAVSRDFFAKKEFNDPNFTQKYPLIEKRKYIRNEVTEEMLNQFYS